VLTPEQVIVDALARRAMSTRPLSVLADEVVGALTDAGYVVMRRRDYDDLLWDRNHPYGDTDV